MSHYPTVEFLKSAAQSDQFPPDVGAEVAFAGRSNCGKSSAINAIVGRRSLARASKTPGRTRLLNFFRLTPDSRIVDLPGYGFATASAAEQRSWVPMIEALKQRGCMRGLFLIVDIRRGLLEGDLQFLDWSAAGQALPIHVLLSKADKLKRTELREALQRARELLPAACGLQVFSAVDGNGVLEARACLDSWISQTPKNCPGGLRQG